MDTNTLVSVLCAMVFIAVLAYQYGKHDGMTSRHTHTDADTLITDEDIAMMKNFRREVVRDTLARWLDELCAHYRTDYEVLTAWHICKLNEEGMAIAPISVPADTLRKALNGMYKHYNMLCLEEQKEKEAFLAEIHKAHPKP